jgi:hypothetical protein
MSDPREADLETPEADAAEQAMSALNDDRDEDGYADPVGDADDQDIEAPEADFQEQHQVVEIEDDDYR